MYPSLAVLVAAFTKRGAGREGLGRGTREQGGLGQGGAREQGGHPSGGGRCEEEEGRARTLSRSTIGGVIQVEASP